MPNTSDHATRDYPGTWDLIFHVFVLMINLAKGEGMHSSIGYAGNQCRLHEHTHNTTSQHVCKQHAGWLVRCVLVVASHLISHI